MADRQGVKEPQETISTVSLIMGKDAGGGLLVGGVLAAPVAQHTYLTRKISTIYDYGKSGIN